MKKKEGSQPCWKTVECWTFVLVLFGMVGAIAKFLLYDQPAIDRESKFYNQKTVQVVGRYFPPGNANGSGQGLAVLEISNPRMETIVITRALIEVTPLSLPSGRREIVGTALGIQGAITAEFRNIGDRVKPRLFINPDESGVLKMIEVVNKTVSWEYLPNDNTGGKVEAGVERQANFWLWVESGNIPAMYKLKLSCWIEGREYPLTWESRIGLGGASSAPIMGGAVTVRKEFEIPPFEAPKDE